jgi:hypothetical protein
MHSQITIPSEGGAEGSEEEPAGVTQEVSGRGRGGRGGGGGGGGGGGRAGREKVGFEDQGWTRGREGGRKGEKNR